MNDLASEKPEKAFVSLNMMTEIIEMNINGIVING